MNVSFTPYFDTKNAAKKIAAYTLEHDGGTFSKNGEPVKERDTWAVGGADPGWQISLKKVREITDSDTFYQASIAESISLFITQLPERDAGTYVGTWIEGDTLYLDAVSLIDAEFDAIAAAADRREKAIYNLSTHETYYLGM